MSDRTFKVESPPMHGDDIAAWQEWLNHEMVVWDVDYKIKEDGHYGPATRSLTLSVLHGLGYDAGELMEHGLTPELRSKARNKVKTPDEAARSHIRMRDWLPAFRNRMARHNLSTPIAVILQDSWGWHPGIHDGVDLICNPSAPLLAICDGRIIRADAGGWWGRGAPSDPALRARGDGIIVLRCTIDNGPFRRGLNMCYGHAEHASVDEGQRVRAGEVIGQAGFANAWHVHFMVNDNNNDRGVGDRDPKPYVDFARGHD